MAPPAVLALAGVWGKRVANPLVSPNILGPCIIFWLLRLASRIRTFSRARAVVQHGFPRKWVAGELILLYRKHRLPRLDLADVPQSIAAATSELWPSIANTLLIPWRGTYNPPTSNPRSPRTSAAHQPTSPANTADTKQEVSFSAQRHGETRTKTELPEILRDAVSSPRFLDHRLAHATPTNIFSEISNMPSRSLTMANPLMRRSYAALMARPLTTLPGFRFMSTHQPSRVQQFSWPTIQRPSQALQYRGFGTGGVSRDLLANREGAANRNPNSATAQNSFYQLLLKANMPAIVIERYQSGRLRLGFVGLGHGLLT